MVLNPNAFVTFVLNMWRSCYALCVLAITDVRQPWTYGNKHLIVGADVRSEYSNIRYLHLIIGKAQKFVSGDKYDF